MTHAHRAIAAVVAIAVAQVSFVDLARADDDDAQRALAAPLFDDGVKAMGEAHCDAETIVAADRPKCRDALDKFRRAFEIYPAGLGALRNAAFCERGLGLVASAMRDFREVARRAPLDPNPSKQLWAKHAQDEAEKLGQRVPHVVVHAGAADASLVSLDGVTLIAAARDVPLPVDPGAHVVVATAPGYQRFERAFEIAEREDVRIDVALVPQLVAPPPPPREVHAPIAPTLLVVAGGAAIVGGVIVGWRAKVARDESCSVDASPIHCHDANGLDRAKHLATASTIVTVAGAGLAVVGSIWFVLDVNAQKKIRWGAVGGPSMAGVAIEGAF